MKKTFTLTSVLVCLALANFAQTCQRIPLYEIFSSSTCGPCVSANSNMKNVFNANPNKFTCVKYQMNWPGSGDIYYTGEGGSRRNYYSVNSIPAMFVEGTSMSSTSYTSADLNNQYNIPAELSVYANYTNVNNTVTVWTTFTPLKNFPTGLYRAQVAVVEKTTVNNASSNGETIFYNVMKKMLPSAAGSNLGTTMTANTPINVNGLTNNFGTSSTVENFANLAVVVFAQDNMNKAVLNSAWATLLTGVTEVEKPGNGITSLFPNPANSSAYVSYQLTETRNVKISVLNMLGQEVFTSNEGEKSAGQYDLEIGTSSLPNGMYIVHVTLGDKVHTSKVSVQH